MVRVHQGVPSFLQERKQRCPTPVRGNQRDWAYSRCVQVVARERILKETHMSWNQSVEKHKQEIEAWTSLCNTYKESLY